MDPINYPMVNPAAAILDGLKIGGGLQQLQYQGQEQQMKLQQHQLALQQAQQQQADLRALWANPNAGHAEYAAVMTKYPALAENIGKAYKTLDEGRQRNELQFGSRVYGALQSSPALAVEMLRERAKVDPAQAQHFTTLADLAEAGPQGLHAARTWMATGLSGMLGPDKFATAFPALQQEQRAADQAPADLALKQAQARKTAAEAAEQEVKAGAAPRTVALANANLESQITERAARLGLDADRLTTETQIRLQELGQKAATLPDSALKIVNDSTMVAVAAEQSAGQMNNLAGQLEKEGGGWGAATSAAEWLAKTTGNQDALTALRQEYVRLRNAAAIKSLPPGVATDKDIELALEGFPPKNADAKHIASFLRGMAKLSQRESLVENARAEWVNAVGHNGKPKTDVEIDGVKVPAGTTFPDFLRKYMPRATQQREAEAVKGRSYMRWAEPQAGAPALSLTPTPSTPAGTGPGR